MLNTKIKHCYKCQSKKDVSEFYRDKSKHDGLEGLCKKCSNAKKNAWSKANPAKEYAKWLNRKQAKAKRSVKWDRELTDLAVIEGLDLCNRLKKITNVDWHIDHVIPLRGKTVSGLHVWNNFRVITAKENAKKGNKYDPT